MRGERVNQRRATWSMFQVWLGLIVALAFALGACGSGTATSTPAASAAATSPAVGTKPTSAGEVAAATRQAGSPGGAATSPVATAPGFRVTGPYPGEAPQLTGAGASFPVVLYSRWFSEYERLTGVRVNYQSIGSGGGIRAISQQTVDFGATDGPMTDQQLAAAQGGLVLHIPTALGAVVATYNVPEMENQPIRFTPETLAAIHLGQLIRWNDPRLVADNPGLANVNRDIVTVHRSDSSGTTYIFTDYLSSVSEEWRTRIGKGTAVNWPTGLGARGNEGIAGEVRQNPYTMGYVELIYAKQNNLGVGQIRNKAGAFVAPELSAVTAAAASAAETIPADLRASIVNAEGAESYPISGFTWLLAYEKQTDQAKAVALTRMLWWAVTDGQQYNDDLGYAPLPAEIQIRARDMIKRIHVNGQPALPAT